MIIACGHNLDGELSTGDYQNQYLFFPLDDVLYNFIESNDKIISISGGAHFLVYLTENNNIYVCGQNTNGQLGLGDYFSRKVLCKLDFKEKVEKICCGDYQMMIITKDGNIYGCGDNILGQLGLGHGNKVCVPTLLINFTNYLKQNNEIIDNIIGSGYFTIFKTKSNKIYACGQNNSLQFGIGDNLMGSFEPIEIPFFSNLNENIDTISCGPFHAFYKTESSVIYTVGGNDYGQLGMNDFDYRDIPSKLTFFEDINESIDKISTSDQHTIFLTKSKKVFVCGYSEFGQLGIQIEIEKEKKGFPKVIKQPILIETFNNLKDDFIIDILACWNYSLFITKHFKIFTCGSNGYGQLGIGHSENEEDERKYIPQRSIIPKEINYFLWENYNSLKIELIKTGYTPIIFLKSINDRFPKRLQFMNKELLLHSSAYSNNNMTFHDLSINVFP